MQHEFLRKLRLDQEMLVLRAYDSQGQDGGPEMNLFEL